MEIGAVILAGGKNRRMNGDDKARLSVDGRTFLDRIVSQLEGFGEVLLSVDAADRYPEHDLRAVEDVYPDSGPMGGLHAALAACRSEALLVVPCDLPLFERGVAEYLTSRMTPDCDVLVLSDRRGQLHPLCGVYAKRTIDVFDRLLSGGKCCMYDVLADVRLKLVPLFHSGYPDEVLANVNTPRDYRSLFRKKGSLPVVAVSGVKDSGKTTLLSGVVPLLKKRGLRVAVIKHDGHDFEPDVAGTDSYRLRRAGADAVGVYSANRCMLVAERTGTTAEDLIYKLDDVDLVLLEGDKRSSRPRIEVVRAANSKEPICDPSTLLALCTDADIALPGVPTLDLNDCEGAARVILKYLENGQRR